MTPTPACRHLHTDGRPCGSPALRGEPFCFHHHTARKPMPRRVDPTDPRILITPQLPAPDDFPAIQRGIGEVLRLLGNDRLSESRAATLLKGLAIASQNLARQHRREEKLAALGLLPAAVTDFVNHPIHGTIAVEPTLETAGCPTFATASSSLRWGGEAEAKSKSKAQAQAEAEAPLPDPIPLFTPDVSSQTSFDDAKSIEMNTYFQTIYDRRAEQFHAWKEQHLHELREEQYRDLESEFERRLETELATRLEAACAVQRPANLEADPQPHPVPQPIPIQQNQDLSPEYENTFALAS